MRLKMSKWKMSWNIIMEQKVVVYTKFIDHNVFRVRLKKGFDTSPEGPIWKTYEKHGLASKADVVADAFKVAEKLLEEA